MARAYMAAGGALNEQASIFWRRRQGEIPLLAQFEREMREAERVYVEAYERFIAEASRWSEARQLPAGPLHP